jgi:hypothetical protein
MRTDLQILRAAIGDASLSLPEQSEEWEGRFHLYQVRLPLPRYRGLPPVWNFAVASGPDRPLPIEEREAFLGEARELIRKFVHPFTHLVLVCEDPAVRLNDRLRFEGKNVFFVDEHTLPGGRDLPQHPRSAPFISAVRSKLDAQDLGTVLFDPYQPDKPASGWRFFGRRRELDRLLNSDESFFVVGSRKIGKTSLLNAVKEQLQERGEAVYTPKLQYLSNAHQVVEAILLELSARDMATAQRRKRVLNEDMLASVLKTISARRGRVTLILDEVGNVVFNNRQEDWRVFGMLREFSHSGKVRVIMSGFQEFFIKQADEFAGPFVNFAGVMRLGGFQDSEIEELLVEPLKLWGRVDDSSALLRMVTAKVGHHPYFLQYLGQEVFRTMFERRHSEAQNIVEDLLRDSLEIFQPPIDALFLKSRSAAMRYLFLKRCHEAASERSPVDQAELTDEWMERTLSKLGYASTVSGRSWILDEFQMRGLTVRANASGSRQRVAMPIIYSFMNESEDIERYLAALARDIVHERRQLLHGPEEGEVKA